MSIVDNLKLELLGEEKVTLVKQHTQNLKAYELYLRGRYFWNKRTGEDMKKSVEYFEQAIEEDPLYALAYTGLAFSYVTLGEWNILPAKEVFPKAKAAATKALEIDNSLAEAHVPLGAVKCNFDWDWQGAEREYKLAIELNPNDASAHQWYSEYLAVMGRFKEAFREIKRAQELDPLSLIINTVEAYLLFFAREYDKGIEQCRKVLEMDPHFPPAHRYLGLNYWGNDMYEEALEEFEKMNNHLFQAVTYAKMEKVTEAKKILENLIEISNKEDVPGISLAIAGIYFALGEDDQGFKWLERAYEKRDRGMVEIKVAPIYDSVRSDPRYKALLKKMNLE
jgi:tetratricopeptide (TPR) repeat protein